MYTRAAAHILNEWDDYSDQHVDEQGWPLDEAAYGRRQRRRDADTWRAFEPVRPHMSELLAAAERQLARLPAHERQPNWPGSLARLSEARTGMEAAYAYWQAERDALLPSSIPGTDAYDEVLAERNADAWSYLCDWADCGHVLTEIAWATARHDTGPAASAAEHTRAPDSALPPQAPGRPHPHRGPR